MKLGYPAVAPSGQAGGLCWQGCVVGALHPHGSCNVCFMLCFQNCQAGVFHLHWLPRRKEPKKGWWLSTQRLAGVGPISACHDCWQMRGRGLCPLLPFSQNECMCLGASACSLAMLMGFMARLLAPEDRCEKGGGREVGGGDGVRRRS